eukprot:Platyproteum_vivax@DN4651_c0_g1_i1.p1
MIRFQNIKWLERNGFCCLPLRYAYWVVSGFAMISVIIPIIVFPLPHWSWASRLSLPLFHIPAFLSVAYAQPNYLKWSGHLIWVSFIFYTIGLWMHTIVMDMEEVYKETTVMFPENNKPPFASILLFFVTSYICATLLCMFEELILWNILQLFRLGGTGKEFLSPSDYYENLLIETPENTPKKKKLKKTDSVDASQDIEANLSGVNPDLHSQVQASYRSGSRSCSYDSYSYYSSNSTPRSEGGRRGTQWSEQDRYPPGSDNDRRSSRRSKRSDRRSTDRKWTWNKERGSTDRSNRRNRGRKDKLEERPKSRSKSRSKSPRIIDEKTPLSSRYRRKQSYGSH